MRSLLIILTFINTAFATDIINEVNYSNNIDTRTSFFDRFVKKLSLNYFVNISGPTLANINQRHTYSRFQSGKTWDERHNLDPKTNQNYFNSFSINYQLMENVSLFYSYAFDNVLTKDISYKSRNSKCQYDVVKKRCKNDSQGFYLLSNGYFEVENKRNESQNFYNQRIGAYFSNLYKDKNFGISSGVIIELPTTTYAKNDNLNYSLILTPSIYFYDYSIGISSEIIKNSYQENIILGDDFYNARKMRTFQISLSPYYNYIISKNLIFKSKLIFDWDQKGRQKGLEFNNNMDDVYRLGFGYVINNNISADLYIEGALENASTNRSFIGGSLSIKI